MCFVILSIEYSTTTKQRIDSLVVSKLPVLRREIQIFVSPYRYTVCLFQACVRKQKKPRINQAVDDIVTEVRISPDASDVTFEHFVRRNMAQMNRIIDGYRRQFGYVSRVTSAIVGHLSFFAIL